MDAIVTNLSDAATVIDVPPSEPQAHYGRLSRRFLAAVVDGLVYNVVLLLVFGTAGSFDLGSGVRFALLAVAVMFILLYEPFLVSLYGQTLGHRATNLRVVANTESGRLGFFKALPRWLLKLVTGILAFITMLVTRRHQALHDLVFGTTVQIADVAKARPGQYALERPLSAGGLPSPLRRGVVGLAYVFVAFLAMTVATLALVSDDCIHYERCSKAEDIASEITGTLFLGGAVTLLVLAWQGRLWGARGQRI